MPTRVFVRVLLIVGFGWLFLLGPGLFTDWATLRHAGGYRPAELLITGSNCIGGQVSRGSDGRQTRSPRYCFVEGTVQVDGTAEGTPEELSVGSTVPNDMRPGTRLRVLYNPQQPPFGMNYLNLRTLPAEGSADVATIARRSLRASLVMILLALGALVSVQLLLLRGVRRLSHPPQQLAVDLGGGGKVTMGAVLFSQGAAFVLAQIPDVAWGGLVLGLLLCAAGGPLLLQRYVVLSKADARMTRGRHFLGVVFGGEELPLPPVNKVVLASGAGGMVVALGGDETSMSLGAGATPERLRLIGARVATFLGVEVEDRIGGEPSQTASAAQGRVAEARRRRRLIRLAIVLAPVGIAALALGMSPGLRFFAAAWVLAPSSPVRHVRPLRSWALDRLAQDGSPRAVSELARLLNTVDAQASPEIASDVDGACLRAAGLTRSAPDDRDANIRAINGWAARRLGGFVDEDGGVLGLLPVESRFVAPVNALTDQDPSVACGAWQVLGVGDLVTPEQFLWAVGPALGDGRPIHFAIKRSGSSVDCDSEPTETGGHALASSVGEALALRLWTMQGVGDDAFPDDFQAWWGSWARQHRLPPLRRYDY
jgi:hypothetical protein